MDSQKDIVRRGCRVLGVDISPEQIRRAQELVPAAEFLCQDVIDTDLEAESFDLVVALYSIINMPLEDHRPLIGQIGRWTRSGGHFLCSLADQESPGYFREDWLGIPGARMSWSHASLETYQAWLAEAGFECRKEEVLVDSGGTRHPVVLAQKCLRQKR
jgi:SAM-dependent methyltransferase